MKKVLLTGATGFIGKYVVGELLKSNCQVIATASSSGKVLHQYRDEKVVFIPFDFRQYDPATDYFTFFQKPDLLIHLAWEGLPNYKALFHFEENLPRHYSFLKNLVANGLKDLTVAGTCLEYGFAQGCLQEDQPTYPTNAYGLAKDTLQKFLQQLQTVHPFFLKWVRLFYMYGKGQNPASLFSQLDKAIANGDRVFNMSGGEQVRDYLPVEKVAENIVKIALQSFVNGVINCCSGQPVKLKDLVQQYVAQNESDIQLNLGYYPYLDYEPMAFWGDTTKLQSIVSNEQSS